MGQYLATGLVVKASYPKSILQEAKWTQQEFETFLSAKAGLDLSLYDMSETSGYQNEEYLRYTLKPSVLTKENLLPFLQEFYPQIYDGNTDLYAETLAVLEKTEDSQLPALAEGKSQVPFQYDAYAHPDWFRLPVAFYPNVSINYHTIMLAMDGKLITEGISGHLRFFRRCVQERFAQFLIARTLKIYTTG
ncbi:MAG: hypothetical protein LBH00_00265 [Planctomycetaceae bacterium]|jgi:hypothetical protein|nr:hypothetical protein [Planctomycetaceae bacterium]